MSPDVRRQQLIEATFESLVLNGETAASVRSIAAAAGLSLGMVRHHFMSKDELLAATYRHLSDRFNAAADEAIATAGADPLERFRAFLLVGLRPPILDRDYVRARYILWSLSDSDKAVRRAHSEAYGRFQRRLEELLSELPNAGAVGSPAELASPLTAFLKGLWVEWLIAPDAIDPKALIERFIPLMIGSPQSEAAATAEPKSEATSAEPAKVAEAQGLSGNRRLRLNGPHAPAKRAAPVAQTRRGKT